MLSSTSCALKVGVEDKVSGVDTLALPTSVSGAGLEEVIALVEEPLASIVVSKMGA